MEDCLYRATLLNAQLLSATNFDRLLMVLEQPDAAVGLESLVEQTPQRSQREALHALSKAWIQAGGSSLELRGCLDGLRRRLCEEPKTELVWSGPSVRGAGYRSTEQVMKEMLGRAATSVLILSYAARDVVSLREQLVAAAGRGAIVSMVLEHYDALRKVPWDQHLRDLGHEVLSRSKVLVWPLERRCEGGGGVRGSLHAKCLVIDRKELLLTSANWTTSAMERNIEMGIRSTDPGLSQRVHQQIEGLVAGGDLMPWPVA